MKYKANQSALHPLETVYLVEDDEALGNAITLLIESEGFKAQLFKSGEIFIDFLKSHTRESRDLAPSCVLLDIRLGQMSGLEVFDKLQSTSPSFTAPVIFLTGHGDLHMAVDVLKKGAFDFVTKPFVSENLIDTLRKGFLESIQRIDQVQFLRQTQELLDSLTERERRVMHHIVDGLHNKDIADLFGNSVRTIEIHRASIFDKMQVKSAIELARVMERYASASN